jgi:DNA-binding transcriptional MerR regulator
MSLSDYGNKWFKNKLWDMNIEDIERYIKDVSTGTKLKIEKIKTESEDEKKQKLREYIKTFNIDMKHVFRDSKYKEIAGDIEEGAEQISEGINYMKKGEEYIKRGERTLEEHGISIYDDHYTLIYLVKEIYREESDFGYKY